MENYKGILGNYSRFFSWLFFIIGLIGAVGLRFVLIANHFNKFLGTLSWYIAIIAFVFFYYYRFIIENKRRKIILENNLKERLKNKTLSEDDFKSLSRIVDSILVSKLKLNFIILFILTTIALIVEIILDLT